MFSRERVRSGRFSDKYTLTKKKVLKKLRTISLLSSVFRLQAAVRRGYIKFLLLKNISHLRESPHKFNLHYYVEFSEDF